MPRKNDADNRDESIELLASDDGRKLHRMGDAVISFSSQVDKHGGKIADLEAQVRFLTEQQRHQGNAPARPSRAQPVAPEQGREIANKLVRWKIRNYKLRSGAMVAKLWLSRNPACEIGYLFERAFPKSTEGLKLTPVTPAGAATASDVPPASADAPLKEETFDAVVQEWADSDALVVVSSPNGANEYRLMARDRLARAGVRRVGAHFKIVVRERRLLSGTRLETDLVPITGPLEIRRAVPNLDPSLFRRE